MSKHSLGPWRIEEGHIQRDSGGIRYWQITDGMDAVACNAFCYAGHDPEVNTANAKLIAKAPEMRAALEEFRDSALYDACMEGPVFKGWNRSQLDRALKLALAALGGTDAA